MLFDQKYEIALDISRLYVLNNYLNNILKKHEKNCIFTNTNLFIVYIHH